jgi:hypothetical protein
VKVIEIPKNKEIDMGDAKVALEKDAEKGRIFSEYSHKFPGDLRSLFLFLALNCTAAKADDMQINVRRTKRRLLPESIIWAPFCWSVPSFYC